MMMDEHEDEMGDIEPENWYKACWLVIDSYFNEKGLVRQQLDSFNEFVSSTIQDIVKDHPKIEIEAQIQHATNDIVKTPQYRLWFDQVRIAKPSHKEEDGTSNKIFPNDARLRRLTYTSRLFVDVK